MRYADYIQHYKIDAEYHDYFELDNFRVEEDKRRYQELLSFYRGERDDRVLEVGSGRAPGLPILNKKGVRYFPLDISFRNLKEVRKRAFCPVFPIVGDAYHLPFQPESFKAIIMSEVLEHLDTPLSALLEAHRVLEKNGILIVTVPYKEKITYQICIHCNRPTPTNSHLHSFDEEKLTKLVRKAGFRPRKLSKNCNKVANRLHFNILLKDLPFPVWKVFDWLFNFLIDKPTSLILVSKKLR